jgi:hypothetical protein
MSAFTRQELWQRLTDARLVSGEMPAPEGTASPWYVRAMLGAAGWLGAIFLLGFVFAGMVFVIENEAAALFAGALCCGGAWGIFRAMGHNDLAAQFGLAVSLAGQILFGYGLHEGVTGGGAAFFFGVAIFEGVLAAIVNNFVHRVWCTLAAALAMSYGFVELGLFGVGSTLIAVAAALLWLDEPGWAPRGTLWRPVGYGLVFALLLPYWAMFGQLLAPDRVAILIPGIQWLRPIVTAGLLVFVVYRILTTDGSASSRVQSAALAAAGIIALVTLRAAGVASSLIILLLGFAGGNRALTGLGIAGMLGYLSYFYYSLQATLLTKSMVLVATGLVLIGFWAAMRYLLGTKKEAVRA